MKQTTVPALIELDGTLVDPALGLADGIAAAPTKPGTGVGWGFAPAGKMQAAGAVGVVHSSTALCETIARRDALPGAGGHPTKRNPDLTHAPQLNEVHTIGNV